jgi:hypothetical protein
MSLVVLLTALLLANNGEPTCSVTLVNSSSVDISLSSDSRIVMLGPGEKASISATSLSSIDFGAINHQFAITPALPILCPSGRELEIEARSNGQLWIRNVDEQPDGMPLNPVSQRDLTSSPPNNSFKRTAAPKLV